MIELNLQHLFPPQRSGDRARSSSNQGWVFLVTSPLLNIYWDPDKSHCISINSGTIERCLLCIIKDASITPTTWEIPKVLGLVAVCQKSETKTKHTSHYTTAVKVRSKAKCFLHSLLSKCTADVWQKHLSP